MVNRHGATPARRAFKLIGIAFFVGASGLIAWGAATSPARDSAAEKMAKICADNQFSRDWARTVAGNTALGTATVIDVSYSGGCSFRATVQASSRPPFPVNITFIRPGDGGNGFVYTTN